MSSNSNTVAFEATPEQIALMEQISGQPARFIELSDNQGFADHQSGPLIAAEIVRLTGTGETLRWEELDHNERRAAVLAAAESPAWCQGNMDPHRVDHLLEEFPSISTKARPTTATS